MEKIDRENIFFLAENKLFNPSQHGFMKGRSCLSASINMIYLDFAKAFDEVWVALHRLPGLQIYCIACVVMHMCRGAKVGGVGGGGGRNPPLNFGH